jgi:hypothetical protein
MGHLYFEASSRSDDGGFNGSLSAPQRRIALASPAAALPTGVGGRETECAPACNRTGAPRWCDFHINWLLAYGTRSFGER